MVSILTLLPVISVQAKPPLNGTITLEYNLAVIPPTDQVPDWVGTIIFEGDENTYGMLFFAIGSGKAFVTSPSDLKGDNHFFEEIWAIYKFKDGGKIFPTLPTEDDWAYWLPTNDPDELVLWGYDKGHTNIADSEYFMNGNVEGATGVFEEWLGRNVHMSGDIIWYPFGAPHYAPGTFRIN